MDLLVRMGHKKKDRDLIDLEREKFDSNTRCLLFICVREMSYVLLSAQSNEQSIIIKKRS